MNVEQALAVKRPQLEELMKRANLWLAPIQGIVAAALGAFFVRGSHS